MRIEREGTANAREAVKIEGGLRRLDVKKSWELWSFKVQDLMDWRDPNEGAGRERLETKDWWVSARETREDAFLR